MKADFTERAVFAIAALAGASPLSQRLIVPGAAFDRYITVWFENTDYAKAAGDPNFQWAATQGISLTNYFAVTHPSQPNYFAVVGGDHFNIPGTCCFDAPANVSTIVDLLEDKGVSWAEYQEDMPSVGYLQDYKNPVTQANMYVRKHNPLASFLSVSQKPKRLRKIRPLTDFYTDSAKQAVPQWVFITPNMTSDGHDSGITVAGNWLRQFLEPLITNEHVWSKTLMLITFDESGNKANPNRVFSVLTGGAVPKEIVGTVDDSFYTHYSQMATVQANWGLHTLGRFDVGANVFKLVANHTGDTVVPPPDGIDTVLLKSSYPGYFQGKSVPFPPPNIELVQNGRTVLPAIEDAWRSEFNKRGTYYKGAVVPPCGDAPPVYI